MREREEKPFDPGQYDREYFQGHLLRYHGPVYSQRVKNVKRYLGDLRDKAVLDLGCGVGFFSELCRAGGARVVSMDFSMEALRFCREEYRDRLALVQGDATALPFPGETFDLVLMNDIIEHLTLEVGRRMLEETRRVLKKGGSFVLDTDNDRFIMTFPGLRRINWAMQKNTPQQKALNQIKQGNKAPSLHVRIYEVSELKRLFKELGFVIEGYDTYPYIAVPARDAFFNLPLVKNLVKDVKGDVQIYRCRKK